MKREREREREAGREGGRKDSRERGGEKGEAEEEIPFCFSDPFVFLDTCNKLEFIQLNYSHLCRRFLLPDFFFLSLICV